LNVFTIILTGFCQDIFKVDYEPFKNRVVDCWRESFEFWRKTEGRSSAKDVDAQVSKSLLICIRVIVNDRYEYES